MTAKHSPLLHSLTFVSMVFSQSALSDNMRNVSEEIHGMRSKLVSAAVWLVPPGRESRFAITERDLVSKACSYYATTTNDLNALIDVLATSQIEQKDDAEKPLPVGIAVYLRTLDGTSISLVATPEYANAPVNGLFNGSVPVVARRGFEEAIWKWARARASTRNTGLCRKQQF